ncbi:MAG: molybdenum cofactor biosynthesis protein MoaB [Desulfobacteraceae bacterium]|nr:molybdenum cofactor biosynthesis protein MoaB [Desulfobacteraceae bacterium]MBU4002749.1 molybdenum cofactor biosynthesis protein MoaB [Pseudomonadota bacterium]MBU4052956.1 molybdenum cofactor biosynthesis protein MoaB [Pseudomonadota bacterium]
MSKTPHKKDAPKSVAVGILTVSTTRTLETDQSGSWMAGFAGKEGHRMMYHQVVPDDAEAISMTVADVVLSRDLDVLIVTGGTGISPKDVTIEAVRPLFEKELTAFGPVYAQLSYEEIDSAAILSRATAGVISKTLIFCIPGSLNACKLACKSLIFPELGHLTKHMKE